MSGAVQVLQQAQEAILGPHKRKKPTASGMPPRPVGRPPKKPRTSTDTANEGETLAIDPEHDTRHKSARIASSPVQPPKSRPQRKLGPRAAPDPLDEDLSQIGDAGRRRPQLRSGIRLGARTSSEQFGYPSPEKQSNAKFKRAGQPVRQADQEVEKNGEEIEVRHGDDHVKKVGEEEEEADEERSEKGEGEEEERDSEEDDNDDDDEAERGQEEQSERSWAREMAVSQHTLAIRNTAAKRTFQEAAEVCDCASHWKAAWRAARKVRQNGEPETQPVQELLTAIRALKPTLERDAANDHDSDLLSESALDKIAMMLGSLKLNGSHGAERENRLIMECYSYAVPWSIDLLRSILITRYVSANEALSTSALEELVLLLKSTRRLCEQLYHWKPTVRLEDRIRSTVNLDIKLSLGPIEDAYNRELADRWETERAEEAKLQERKFLERRARLDEERRQQVWRKRQEMAIWRERVLNTRAITKRPARVPIEHHTYDIDDLELDEVDEADRQVPASTRSWQQEERLALLLLLQLYGGPDRYERIQEKISDIARDIRKRGVDNCARTGGESRNGDLADVPDVLDDLGIMEVRDVEEQAKYLKASQLQMMEEHVRATGDSGRWSWLMSV